MQRKHICELDVVVKNGYCTGCGLCVSVIGQNKLRMVENSSGFLVPESLNGEKLYYDRDLCPGITVRQKLKKTGNEKIYGPFKTLTAGHSTDKQIRKKASSGGVITGMLCFLLEESLIDGVLHIGKDLSDPLKSTAYYSVTRQEIIDRAGSRYAPSCLLSNFIEILETGAQIAVVGKPCDIVAVRLFLEKNPEYKKQVVITLSFMCMGMPSYHGTNSLAGRMGCEIDNVSDFWYRGNGWPGKATIIDKSNNRYECSYNQSWGETLSGTVNFRCKICPDGYGEFADISCGDAWHSKDGAPDFEESDGRSIIFVRSSQGEDVYNAAINSDYIDDAKFDIEELQVIQQSQYSRKLIVCARIFALKLLGDKLLRFSGLNLWGNLREVRLRLAIVNFLGMLKRRVFAKCQN